MRKTSCLPALASIVLLASACGGGGGGGGGGGPSCTFTLSATAGSVPSDASAGTLTVTTQAGCAWTAASSAGWLTVSAGAAGTGAGTVVYAYQANPALTPRSATLTIGGQAFVLTQGAAPCLLSISPENASHGPGASAGTVTVTASNPACGWGATASDGWLTVTAGATGTGSGAASYQVQANGSSSSRNGTLLVAGHVFRVAQGGQGCTYGLSATGLAVAASGEAGSVGVTAGAGCAWAAASNAPWLSITAGAGGSGDGAVSFTAEPNPTTTPRSGTLTVAGSTFTVTQGGASCAFTVQPLVASFAAAATPATLTVKAPGGCAWTASSAAGWITISSGASGDGNGTVSLALAANPAATSRTGTLTVAGETVSITQGGVGCSYALSATTAAAGAAGGPGSVSVTAPAGCGWAAGTSVPWLSVTAGVSGSGNGPVQFAVAPNPSHLARAGALTVAGLTFTVAQDGAPCSYGILPGSGSYTSAAASGAFAVTSPEGCPWAAASDSTWVSLTAGDAGSGDGAVSFLVAANASPASRSASVDVTGVSSQTVSFRVAQGGLPCVYQLSTSSTGVVHGGGTGSVGLTTLAGCAWTASTAAPWITVTSGAAGSGPGTVRFSVTPNPTALVRRGIVEVAGQLLTVDQEPAPCTATLTPAAASFAAAGGNGAVAVAIPEGCGWTATEATAWIAVDAGALGIGAGDVQYSVSTNPTASSRTAPITIAGVPFPVSQAGVGCSFALSAASTAVGAGGASSSVSVLAPAGCAWAAASDAPWISVVAGASGNGDGTVHLEVQPNPSSLGRTGTATVAGRTFTVTQAGVPCTFAVFPGSASFGPAGGNGGVAVTAPEGCAWTATSGAGWTTVDAGASGSGSGTVQFTVAANALITSRTTAITVADKTFTVAQGGAACSYDLSAGAAAPPAGGATGTVSLTAQAGCTWTASSDAAWLTVTSGAAGSGGGTVGWRAAANDSTAPRTATLTIGGRAFTVTQDGATCSYALSPTSASYGAAASSGSVVVTAPSGCAWTATGGAPVATITSGASGNGGGTVFYTVSANGTASARTGTLTVAGIPFAITQGGAGCTYAVAPASFSAVAAAGGPLAAAVTATGGCAWTTSSNAPWITVTAGATGTGNGSIGLAVAANTATAPRTGTVTVAGQTVTVTQVAAPCAYALTPASAAFAAAAADAVVTVATTPECSWTASTTTPWITVGSGASGAGSGLFTVSVSLNAGSADRAGSVTLSGQGTTLTFSVTQTYGADTGIEIR